MLTDYFSVQDYHIVNHSGLIEAAAQFIYKDYQISFSTMGALHGACRNHVVIYGFDCEKKDFTIKVNMECSTVEEAIEYINNLQLNKFPLPQTPYLDKVLNVIAEAAHA